MLCNEMDVNKDRKLFIALQSVLNALKKIWWWRDLCKGVRVSVKRER